MGKREGTFKTEQIYCLTGKATLGQNHPFLGVLFFLFLFVRKELAVDCMIGGIKRFNVLLV